MRPDLVMIALSTGGPEVLRNVIPKLEKDLGVPVIIVQHMLEGHTKVLAETLDKISNVKVIETFENLKLENSKVYLAKAGVHIKLNQNCTAFPEIIFSDEPKVNFVKPAADVLFKNVAENQYRKNVLVIVGTGMGKDGLEGIRALKEKCNCYCITQDKKDCAIYGMPKMVFDAGYSDEVVELNNIASRINMICKKGW